jgi:hypothetical protein
VSVGFCTCFNRLNLSCLSETSVRVNYPWAAVKPSTTFQSCCVEYGHRLRCISNNHRSFLSSSLLVRFIRLFPCCEYRWRFALFCSVTCTVVWKLLLRTVTKHSVCIFLAWSSFYDLCLYIRTVRECLQLGWMKCTLRVIRTEACHRKSNHDIALPESVKTGLQKASNADE